MHGSAASERGEARKTPHPEDKGAKQIRDSFAQHEFSWALKQRDDTRATCRAQASRAADLQGISNGYYLASGHGFSRAIPDARPVRLQPLRYVDGVAEPTFHAGHLCRAAPRAGG